MRAAPIAEWPARIAEVALWLMDHQMNIRLSEAFGQLYRRLPLKKSPHIHQANALRVDWKEILPPDQCSYVLGNPPFIGHHLQTKEQKGEQMAVLYNIQSAGVMDYVSNWYVRAAEYIQGTQITVAFVSTSSISQGEQVCILWNELFSRYKLKIHFAHRTFAWESEARGKAHVHVVIIGFGLADVERKVIYDYEANPDHPTVSRVRNISPYLIEGNDTVLANRSDPICDVPGMSYGNKPTDGGHFILSDEERDEMLRKEPASAKYIRPYLGAQEVLDGTQRWCLWLVDITPDELRHLTGIRQHVEAVREFRLSSKAETTREYANYPTLFRQIAQPKTDFVIIPRHTSETRRYIPFAYFAPENIVSDSCFFFPMATRYHFGTISSAMHMAWVRQVCGRLESRYRYSKDIVYNNFPWTQSATAKQKEAVEAAAQKVLDVRAQFLAPVGQTSGLPVKEASGSQSQNARAETGSTATPPEEPLTGRSEVCPTKTASLADLYDPLSMPPALVKAHAELDRAVDLCYRPQPFTSERQRVEYLFGLYEQLTAPLLPAAAPKRGRKRLSA